MSPVRRLLTVVSVALTTVLVASSAGATPAGPPVRPPVGPGPDTSLTAHTYGYADAPVGQPLKGFAPYLFPGDNYASKYPGGVMWSYFALSEVMTDASSCGVFDWSVFERALDEAAVWGRQLAFRFYVEYPGGTASHPGNGIPTCLNGKMALRNNGFWGTVSPDYDDPDVIAAFTGFINAFAARYDHAGSGGTADPRIGFMSLGLVGLWGEWHTWPYDRDTADGYPNLMPTDATIRTIIQAYDTAFDNIQLEVRYPHLAGAESANIGFHDDSWPYKEWRGGQLKSMTLPVSMNGWTDAYAQLLLDAGVENRWTTQSIGGEARPEIQGSLYANWPGGSGQVDDVLAATELTHITWMINQTGAGGYSVTDPKVAAGVRKMGYNLHIPQAHFNGTASGTFKVGVTMQNDGVAPFYYPWTVVLGLRNASGSIVKTWDTDWDLRQVQPLRIRAFPDWSAGADPTYLDYGRPVNFSATVNTAGVAAGNYSLVLRVRSPLETVTPAALRSRPAASRLTDWVIDQWRAPNPLSFANSNQGTDGWVNLGPLSTTGACMGDCAAPSTPMGLAVTGVTDTSVSLSWSASTDTGGSGLAGYDVYRDGMRVTATPVTATSFTDPGRSPGQTYQYTVRAVDNAGNTSAHSAPVTATTTGCVGDCTPPTVPAGLTSPSQTSTTIALSWSASSDNVGVTGYQVLRAGTPVATLTATSYTDTGLTPATAYTYTVKAVDAAGNVSAASAPLTVSTAAAANPNSYEAEASGNTLAGGANVATCTPCSGGAKVGYIGNGGTLTFTGVNGGAGGATAVTVYYASAETRTATINANGGTAQTVTFPSTGGWTTVGSVTLTLALTGGANTVTVANPSGWAPDIDRITLASSGGGADTTPPSAPTGLTSPTQTSTSIALTWNASTDNVAVTGYRVYRAGTEVGTASSTSFTDTGLSASTAYAYTVRAYDAAGNLSAASTTLNVSTNTGSSTGLVVDNFDGTPAYPAANLNDLGRWTGGNCFLNGGSGTVAAGALSLQYNNCGWFGSDVNTDVSAHTYLVVRIKGSAGGEQSHFNISLGGVTKVFADVTLDGGTHPIITTSYQDIRIPMATNGISRTSPGQLAMGFWYGGNSTISIDELRFE